MGIISTKIVNLTIFGASINTINLAYTFQGSEVLHDINKPMQDIDLIAELDQKQDAISYLFRI